MYFIEPYKSIGKLRLGSSLSEIEQIIGKGVVEKSIHLPDVDIGKYTTGITIEYVEDSASFIGIIISLLPVHLNFDFSGKSFEDVYEYFRLYPEKIYVEGETLLVSEFLGITTYFEDGIKEVGIFSRKYFDSMIDGLKMIN